MAQSFLLILELPKPNLWNRDTMVLLIYELVPLPLTRNIFSSKNNWPPFLMTSLRLYMQALVMLQARMQMP